MTKIKFLFFHAVVGTREGLTSDVSINTVGLILTKLWRFISSGYGQTGFRNPHMETCRHTKNFILKFKVSCCIPG